jgi:hypothetical protein
MVQEIFLELYFMYVDKSHKFLVKERPHEHKKQMGDMNHWE